MPDVERPRVFDISLRFRIANQMWVNACIGILSVILMKVIFDSVSVDILDIAEVQKCPFCYGKSLCPQLTNESIKTNASLMNRLIFLLNPKKPLKGSIDNQDVYIKKLATASEFNDFDNFVCEKFYNHYNSTECFDKAINYFTTLNEIYETKNVSDKLMYCTNNSFPTVLRVFTKNVGSKSSLPTIDELFMFWTLFRLNPEPLMLQLLKAEEGWPVPKYFGSCGRLSIVEHCGKDLTDFVNAPLPVRMNLSLQVLDIAFNFTFSHKDYAFYFTDISPMNLVVDQNKTVTFIDLEHVIISEKTSDGEKLEGHFKETLSERLCSENRHTRPDINGQTTVKMHFIDKYVVAAEKNDWDCPHLSEHIECKNCLAFSTEKICQHHISDHNFYAICKEIFGNSMFMPGGLLHTPSDCLLSTAPGLPFLIDNCIQPSSDLTRFQVAKDLKELIQTCLLSDNILNW